MKLTTTTTTLALMSASLCFAAGCKKSGGGGGGWLVGTEGLMANIDEGGKLAGDYALGSSETLYGIACRFVGEAWVVGAHGTLLYTSDGGQSWESQGVPATGDLRALATQDAGPVFIAGDGTFLLTEDSGDHWSELSDGRTNFRSLAAAQRGSTVLALSDDGGLWSYDVTATGGLTRRATIAGARAIAVSPDGQSVIVAGAGIQISRDAGRSFVAMDVDASIGFEAARIDDHGEAIAVGAKGAVANINHAGTTLVQHVGTADLHTVHMKTWGEDTASGYLAGEDGQVYLTTDAGWSWSVGPNVGRAVLGVDELGEGHN